MGRCWLLELRTIALRGRPLIISMLGIYKSRKTWASILHIALSTSLFLCSEMRQNQSSCSLWFLLRCNREESCLHTTIRFIAKVARNRDSMLIPPTTIWILTLPFLPMISQSALSAKTCQWFCCYVWALYSQKAICKRVMKHNDMFEKFESEAIFLWVQVSFGFQNRSGKFVRQLSMTFCIQEEALAKLKMTILQKNCKSWCFGIPMRRDPAMFYAALTSRQDHMHVHFGG